MKKISVIAVTAALIAGSAVSANAATQGGVASWGLDRLDQTNTLFDKTYNYPDSAGAGVRVYVLDTGVQGNRAGFEGRVLPGYDAVNKGGSANTDCHGHGTHVAGIIASATYGVAKKATIVPVRIADCNGFSYDKYMLEGLNWVAKNHPAGTVGVINMSVAVAKSDVVNALVDKLLGQGLVSTVAAGNYATDACSSSPGSATKALTVAATNMNDYRSNNSNFGSCVDLYAPGGLIVSEGLTTESATKSGTSMAAPHVAGALALYISQSGVKNAAVAAEAIVSSAQAGVVVNAKTVQENRLLNVSNLKPATIQPVPAPTTTTAPTPVAAAPVVDATIKAPSNFYATDGGAKLVWSAPAGSTPTAYQIEISYDNGKTWSKLVTTIGAPTDVTITKSTKSQTYYRIAAIVAGVAGKWSPTLLVRK